MESEEQNIKNLVFSGGGLNGIAYIGVLEYLQKNDLLHDITCFAGSSIGALFALLASLKVDHKVIYNKIMSKDLTELQDPQILSVLSDFGLDNMNRIKEFIIDLCDSRLRDQNMTFIDHYVKTDTQLIIVGTNLSKKKPIYFSYINTPNEKVLDSLLISMAIPLLFTPRKYKGDLCIDAAITDNFPMHLFKDKNGTLGIKLIKDNTTNNPTSIVEYTYSIIMCMLKKDSNQQNVINIHINGSPINFHMDYTEKLELYNKGLEAILQHFKLP